MADKGFGRCRDRRVALLPDPKRFKQKFPLLVAQIVEMVQDGPHGLEHHCRCADCGGSQDGSVEYRNSGLATSAPPQRHLGYVQGLWRVLKIIEEQRSVPKRSAA